MNIPIGPRNRLLNFINYFSIYKENFKIKKIDLNSLNHFLVKMDTDIYQLIKKMKFQIIFFQ